MASYTVGTGQDYATIALAQTQLQSDGAGPHEIILLASETHTGPFDTTSITGPITYKSSIPGTHAKVVSSLATTLGVSVALEWIDYDFDGGNPSNNLLSVSNGNNFTIKNCIVHNVRWSRGSECDVITISGALTTCTIDGLLIYDCENSSIGLTQGLDLNLGGSASVKNVTVIGPNNTGSGNSRCVAGTDDADHRFENVLAIVNSTGSGTHTSYELTAPSLSSFANCASSDSLAPGTDAYINISTNDFVDYANNNFRLVQDSILIDAGTNGRNIGWDQQTEARPKQRTFPGIPSSQHPIPGRYTRAGTGVFPKGRIRLNTKSEFAHKLEAWYPLSGYGIESYDNPTENYKDFSGNGRDLTPNNFFTDPATTPFNNQVLRTNQSTGHLKTTDAVLKDLPLGDFTVAFWVYDSTLGSNKTSLSFEGVDDLNFCPSSNDATAQGLRVFWRDTGGNRETDSVGGYGDVYQVAYTKRGDVTAAYVNGKVVDTLTGGLADIGPFSSVTLFGFNGSQGNTVNYTWDFRFYSYGMSASQIKRMYSPQHRWDLYQSTPQFYSVEPRTRTYQVPKRYLIGTGPKGEPRGAVTVDLNNPITRGMVGCYVPGQGDVLRRAAYVGANGTIFSDTRKSFKGDGSKVGASSPFTPTGVRRWSVLTVSIPKTASGANFLYCTGTTLSSFPRGWGMTTHNSKYLYNIHGVGGSFNVVQSDTSDAGVPHVSIGVTRGDTDHEIFVDGLSKATSATDVSTKDVENASNIPAVGGLPDSNSNIQVAENDDAELFFGCVWTRDLSDDEVARLSADPYQFLKPATPTTWQIRPQYPASTDGDIAYEIPDRYMR